MKTYIITLLVTFSLASHLFSQADTLVCYDCRTKQVTIIPPKTNYSNKDFDYTSWNYGQVVGKENLDNTKPQNTFQNGGFTHLEPAQYSYDISNYPIRAVVKKFSFENDTMSHCCTGTLIAPNLMLTCAHCPWFWYQKKWTDSILVVPAFNNGEKNPLFKSSMSKKYYIPKSFYDNKKYIGERDDIAIVELYEPIGFETGWMGIAYHTDPEYCMDKIFHKFSYPSHDPNNVNRFNGDTLYYNYGSLSYCSPIRIAYIGDVIGGQSGSPLFVTDNVQYLLFGIASHSPLNIFENGRLTTIEGFFHYRIQKSMFYALKPIIENNQTDIVYNTKTHPSSFILSQNYPNPFNPSTIIKYNLKKANDVGLKIYSISGQEIEILVNGFQTIGEYEISLQPKGMPSGIYFYRLQAGEFSETRKLIFQK
jgi:V8-like Glu-specific endopeptidase